MTNVAESRRVTVADEGMQPLYDQIDAAVRDRTTPISRLLKLMSALDADATANENLRLRLRARIGAPRIV